MVKKLSDDIFYDISDINLDEEVTLEDIKEIESLFDTQPLIEPPENLICDIMDNIELKYEEENVENEVYSKKNICITIRNLLFNVRHQVSLLDKRFWIVSTIILIFGFLSRESSSGFGIILLGPVVSLLSIYYMYRGRYYNVYEMEAACKYSMYEVTVARTIIILVYNIMFASVMAFINYITWDINIWVFLILTWLAPLLMSYCVMLYFYYKSGVIRSLIINVFIWSIYVAFFQIFFKIDYSAQSYSYVLQIYNNSVWLNINLTLILISVIILCVIFKNIKKNFG